MSEQSIAAARASVMVYDEINKKWVHSGSSSGLSKVHIYQHLTNNTFRVVGRKLQDHEVVINCSIPKSLKYNQATPTFHQWRDGKQVYGLNFSSRDDAEAFAIVMMRTLDIINQNNTSRPSPHSVISQPLYQTIPGDIDANNIDPKWSENDGRINHQIQYTSTTAMQSSNGPQNMSSGGSPNNTMHRSMAPPMCAPAPPAPPQPPMQTNAAPPPPPPPPPPPGPGLPSCPPPIPNQGPPPPPAPPMAPTNYNNGPPCPPPPPSMPLLAGGAQSLASALANAKLKKTSKTNDGGSEMNKPGGAPQSNMANMMDEMAKTLARRRAQAEGNQNSQDGDMNDKKSWDKQNNGSNAYNNSPGLESPKGNRRQRIGSISEMDGIKTNGNDYDPERFKQEILVEMRMEINKMKQDIIDVIRMELNRR